MRSMIGCITLLNLFIYFTSSEDLFSNPFRIMELFREEHKFVQILRTSDFHKLGFTERYLSKYDSVQRDIDETQDLEKALIDKLVTNPLHVYSLIRRLRVDFSELHKKLNATDSPVENKDGINVLVMANHLNKEFVEKITTTDEVGATLSLTRIQSTYYLDPYEMANGNLQGRITNARLSYEDLVDVARSLYTGSYRIRIGGQPEYALAIEWVEASLRLIKENRINHIYKEFENFLQELKDKHDEYFDNNLDHDVENPNDSLFIDKFNGNRQITSKVLRKREKDYFGKKLISTLSLRSFYRLCRGEETSAIPKKEALSCFIENYGDSYLMIQPVKVEVISSNPMLYQLHDVIPISYINKIKYLSKDMFQRAGLEGNQTDIKSFERTQSSTWLYEADHSILLRTSKYLESATRLSLLTSPQNLNSDKKYNTDSAEPYQIGVYTPGGLYFAHMDTLVTSNSIHVDGKYIGNRLATLMIYLSNVDGGKTAFPHIHKAATPKEGSAVLWFNMKSDGTIDDDLLHGACPTIYGLKWVSNKWIRSYGQLFLKPCHLKPNTRFIHK